MENNPVTRPAITSRDRGRPSADAARLIRFCRPPCFAAVSLTGFTLDINRQSLVYSRHQAAELKSGQLHSNRISHAALPASAVLLIAASVAGIPVAAALRRLSICSSASAP